MNRIKVSMCIVPEAPWGVSVLYMMSARLRYVNGSAVTAASPLHGNSVITYIYLSQTL